MEGLTEKRPKYFQVPQAVKDTKPVIKVSKKGNKYTMWTEAWFINIIRGQMREVFAQWPRRKEVFERCRREEWSLTKSGKERKRPVVWHTCEGCGFPDCKQTISKKNPKGYRRLWIDHIDPVVPPGANLGWNEFIFNLFCDPKNLQGLCCVCHKAKTKAESAERAKIRKNEQSTVSWR